MTNDKSQSQYAHEQEDLHGPPGHMFMFITFVLFFVIVYVTNPIVIICAL